MPDDRPQGAPRHPRDMSLAELLEADPATLPEYADPKGRTILTKHRRRAIRECAAMGIDASNGDHALYICAAKGINVFGGRGPSMLGLAAGAGARTVDRRGKSDGDDGPGSSVMQAPVMLEPGRDLAGYQPATEAEREAEIRKIRRGLVRRRRRRLLGLALRLIVFVLLPTALVGYYYFNVATPMFETESEFVIQTAESPAGAAGGIGGILAGTGFATSQDSVVVQGYLSSREAFRRLDAEHGYIAHFQDPAIDGIQRLAPDASLDAAYDYYLDKVTIGYDPTEGVIRMAVIGATPEASQRFAEALIGYAEERVDGLTQEARGDQLRVAEDRYREAELDLERAEQRVLNLQEQRGVFSADVELNSQMSIINNLEMEAENRRLSLSEMLNNPQPNQTRVDVLRSEIARLDARIAELRGQLTQASDSTVSLARISAELRMAESALETRYIILQESVAAMETARLEAARQVRYLSLGVAPVAPVEATYPRKLENTVLAFIVFFGIYIMASITVSILREQVSV
ncbi:capsule biosynthesis protein [Halovulum dunhuangense]|uniref:Capsule biosynthesis protein n=1 Tax=Halovulum dunhuangense TaxID=1505036 RepID=A0A849L0X6_9RHOB|nr:capsule biosynthesis protein [Halovulum dunhuangense]NNU79895.1 capsule biosynthesis protein [Halovulum dunhuangense]